MGKSQSCVGQIVEDEGYGHLTANRGHQGWWHSMFTHFNRPLRNGGGRFILFLEFFRLCVDVGDIGVITNNSFLALK